MNRALWDYRRCGTSTIELLVSFVLLTAVLGASLPLVVRHGRILTSARHYRMALDELSDQADGIMSLRREAAESAVASLKPSSFAVEHLPDVKLAGELAPPEAADRVTLSITWAEPGRQSAPVSLVVWLRTADSVAPSSAVEDTP
jgi:hypothetical protein